MESLKLYPKLLIICLLFSFFWPQTSFAQEETIEIEPAYTLRSYTIENGLPDNGINKIYQDRQGFIWVATQDGLVRFDGYDFLTYRREADAEQPGLLGNDIRDIYEDESEGAKAAGLWCISDADQYVFLGAVKKQESLWVSLKIWL